MKEIILTKGHVALVDDEDFERVMACGEWHVQIKPNGNKYAIGLLYFSEPRRTSTRRMHRVVMDAKPGQIVDHINGNGLDNRRANLRLTDSVGNARNRRRVHTRQFKGVRLQYRTKAGENRFIARICRQDRKVETIGVFPTAEEAARAYDAKAVEYFGEYAATNF